MDLKISNSDTDWCPKYFAVITGFFCGLYMITTALGGKIAVVAGLTFPAAIFLFPLCCIITDLLTEVYGFNRTRQAIWTVLALSVFFAVASQIATMLPPAPFWDGQDAFAKVFATTWRLALAGSLAWIAGELANSLIMSKLKIVQNAKSMPARFIGSTVVGQFLDSLIFAAVAFAGTMPWGDLVVMMLTMWGLKVGYEIIALPLSVPITNWVKKLEGVEHFDRQKLRVV